MGSPSGEPIQERTSTMGYFAKKAIERAEDAWGVSFGDPEEVARHERLMNAIRRAKDDDQEQAGIRQPRFLTNTHYWRQRAWAEGLITMDNDQAAIEWVNGRWILTMGSRRESIKLNPVSGLWTCGGYDAHYDLSGMLHEVLTHHGYDADGQDVYMWAIDAESDED